jgi:predicted transcriptional regulator of viral defense system
LLASWERERRARVTLAELRAQAGQRAAADIVRSLTRKGLLERIGRGVYLVHPFRTLHRPQTVSAALATAMLLADESYYLGGLWAFSLNRLTEQVYSSALDAFVTREYRARTLGNARVKFHVVLGDAFDYGTQSVLIEGARVNVSDPERTLLDALDHPDVVGSMNAAVRLVEPCLARTDRHRLIEYAVRGSRTSTCQRLGVLLQRLQTADRELVPLLRRVQETASVLSLLPDLPRTGPVNKKWRVVENDRQRGKPPYAA